MAVPFARCNAAAAVAALGLVLVTMVHGEGTSVCYTENGTPTGGDEYMCVDWSVGSQTMRAAQGKHLENEQEEVIFGMGSYGGNNDNMGKCYKFYLDTTVYPIIGQVTNFGSDIESAQFDMQMGGGGFGVWNVCAGTPSHTLNETAPCDSGTETQSVPVWPLFSGSDIDWGKRCGGQITIDGCLDLPVKPTTLSVLPNNERTLRELCQDAFMWNVRGDGFNPEIMEGERIKCPSALLDVTTLKRNDDDSFGQETMSPGILTSTMDCCAPAGAYTSNNPSGGTVSGFERLIPCTRDGYTRSTL